MFIDSYNTNRRKSLSKSNFDCFEIKDAMYELRKIKIKCFLTNNKCKLHQYPMKKQAFYQLIVKY